MTQERHPRSGRLLKHVQVTTELGGACQRIPPGKGIPNRLLSHPFSDVVGKGIVGYPGIFSTGGEIVNVLMRQFEMDMTARSDGDQVHVGYPFSPDIFRQD